MILPPFWVICLEIVCRAERCISGAVHKECFVGAAVLMGQLIHGVGVVGADGHGLHIHHLAALILGNHQGGFAVGEIFHRHAY